MQGTGSSRWKEPVQQQSIQRTESVTTGRVSRLRYQLHLACVASCNGFVNIFEPYKMEIRNKFQHRTKG